MVAKASPKVLRPVLAVRMIRESELSCGPSYGVISRMQVTMLLPDGDLATRAAARPGWVSEVRTFQFRRSVQKWTEQLRSWSAASFGTGSLRAAAISAADGRSPPGIVQLAAWSPLRSS